MVNFPFDSDKSIAVQAAERVLPDKKTVDELVRTSTNYVKELPDDMFKILVAYFMLDSGEKSHETMAVKDKIDWAITAFVTLTLMEELQRRGIYRED